MTPRAHQWHPITDLGEDPKSLTDGELEPLGRIWARSKSELTGRGALDEFQKRLRREWSIETGIIENVYTLDRGVTKTLIEEGISAALIPHGASNRDGVAVARIIQDHYDALEDMFDFVAGRRDLSTSYIKTLHAALLRNQETYTVVDQFKQISERSLEKGQYKTAPNSPTRPDGWVHEYCPPEHVASEMDELIRMLAVHQSQGVPPEVEAAWLHHRFTQIHPFSDGNGRVARAIASLVFIKSGWFPLIVKRDDWSRYIEALEKADNGDLRTLVAMFVEAQRNAVIQATEIAYETRTVESAEDAILAARDRLMDVGKLPSAEWQHAKSTAELIAKVAQSRLMQLEARLYQEIGQLGKGFSFSTHGPGDVTELQIVPPSDHDHANPGTYDKTVYIKMVTTRTDYLAVAFRNFGRHSKGLIEVSAYLGIAGDLARPIHEDSFQINYEEDPQLTESRFSPWLERVIVKGLDQWRRTL